MVLTFSHVTCIPRALAFSCRFAMVIACPVGLSALTEGVWDGWGWMVTFMPDCREKILGFVFSIAMIRSFKNLLLEFMNS